jgi:hypothetical protein
MQAMRLAHGWLIVPLLAACAASGPKWEKAGAGQTAIDEDEQRCRVEARLEQQPSLAQTQLSSGTPLLDRGQERDAQEEQRIRQCMQNKGYSAKR